MIRSLVIVIGIPLLVGVAAVVPVSQVLGPQHWTLAGIAFGLTVPPSLVTLSLSQYLIRTSPLGLVLAVFVGTFVRLVVGYGGGVIVFFVVSLEARADKAAYWLWLLFAYLTTLATDTALLARAKSART